MERLRVFGAIIGIAIATVSAPAQDAAPTQGAPGARDVASPRGTEFEWRSDTLAMEAFFDGAIPQNLAEKGIAGMAVTVVHEGDLVFSKGYGYADIETGRTVDPAHTIFRIGSVSKLFTWTAVMQLVEEGLIDLDRDIAEYIDIEIPRAFEEPITMRHLMTHTPGFEDRAFELWRHSEEEMVPLEEWLAAYIPAQVRPPGRHVAYSNFGVAIAGRIVENVSGLDYDEYIDTRVLAPLGMEHSSSRQPIPAALADDLASAYQRGDRGPAAQEFEWINIAPAGSISATPRDMARFMVGHLEGGGLLSPATLSLMHSQAYAGDDRVNGMTYGFFEMDAYGERAIGHGGDTLYYHSVLVLWPERQLGVFITCNSAEGGGTPNRIAKEFARYLFADGNVPETSQLASASTSEGSTASLVAGRYGSNRMSYTTGERLMRLLSGINVVAVDDRSIITPADGSRYVEVAPYLYRHVQEPQYLYFQHDEDGKGTHAFVGGSPVVLERIPAADRLEVNGAILLLAGILSLVILIGRPLSAIARRGCVKPIVDDRERALRSFYFWVAAIGTVLLANMVALATAGDLGFLLGDIPGRRLLYVTVPLFGLTTVVGTGLIAVAWYRRTGGTTLRVRYSLTTISGWGLLWFAAHWNLLTW